tara:strand:+ start:625 stop:783 length:159 start_codon:yes stop_codon:yes gene_type:complete
LLSIAERDFLLTLLCRILLLVRVSLAFNAREMWWEYKARRLRGFRTHGTEYE